MSYSLRHETAFKGATVQDTFLHRVGDTVGGGVFAATFAQVVYQPLSWQDFSNQLIFGFVTALGAALATTTDFPPARPAEWPTGKPDRLMRYRFGEVLTRIFVGGVIGMIFAALLIDKCGLGELKSAQLAVCGMLGILSWYLLRGFVAVGQWIRDAGILRRVAQKYVGVDATPLPPSPPAAPPAQAPAVNSPAIKPPEE